MRSEWEPTTMSAVDFCTKWGFRNVTTSRMTGQMWSNGIIDVGYSSGNFIYRRRYLRNGERNTSGLCGFKVPTDMYHWAHDCIDEPKFKDLFYNYGRDLGLGLAERNHAIQELIFSYLDQFPRLDMRLSDCGDDDTDLVEFIKSEHPRGGCFAG